MQMPRQCFRSSRPDKWTMPRPNMDPIRRRIVYGPVLPMEEENKGWLRRLLPWG